MTAAEMQSEPKSFRTIIGSVWTQEKTEEFLRLWDSTMSCSAIAAALGTGFSRNAVIGKAHRMNLPARGAREVDPQVIEARKTRHRTKIVEAQRARRKTVRPALVAPAEPPPVIEPIDDASVSFADIGPFQCRWIGNDDMAAPLYCGHATVDGSSWCGFHKAIVMPSRREVSEQEAQRRRERGVRLGMAQVASRRSGLDLRSRNAAAG